MIKYLANIDFVLWSLRGRPSSSKWSKYADKHPEDEQFIRALSVMSRLSFNKPEMKEDEKRGLYNSIIAQNGIGSKTTRNRVVRIVSRVAAVVVCALFVGSAVWFGLRSYDHNKTEVADVRPLPLSSVEMPEQVTIISDNTATAISTTLMARVECNSTGEIVVNGEQMDVNSSESFDLLVPKAFRATVTLADNTKIWLNENTKIRISSQSGASARSVEIDGEGFFKVTHNPDDPFVVSGQEIAAVVKGTTFDICSSSNPNLRQYVVLIDGCVEVDMPTIGERVTLAPKQVLNYNNNSYMTTTADISSYIGWREESIVINNNSIVEIIASLSDYYGIETSCANKVSKICCSGRLVLFDDINKTLEVLTSITPIRYEWRGKTLYVESN